MGKAALTTCLQYAINRANAAVCGHRSARHHVGAMTVVSSTTQSAAVVCSMHLSQLAIPREWCAVVRRCAVQTCQRPKRSLQKLRKPRLQRKPNSFLLMLLQLSTSLDEVQFSLDFGNSHFATVSILVSVTLCASGCVQGARVICKVFLRGKPRCGSSCCSLSLTM